MVARSFRAMGTGVELLLDAGPEQDAMGVLLRAEAEVERLEALLSRFRPASELSRLNAAGSMRVGPELLELTRIALAERDRTGGRFDPTVHDAVVAAGYDRSFDGMPEDRDGDVEARPCGGGVAVDAEARTITLDQGVHLDLGGIAKGWTAERIADLMEPAGPCLVSVGGDMALRGPRATGPWTVGVTTGDGSVTLALDRGAIATSGRDRRRWTRGGREAHHIIDPSSGAPSETDLLRVTVVAHGGPEAEATAKALMLAGSARAAEEAEERGIPCVLVGMDGSTRLTGGLA
ncbi:MAG: FAD:protein FMN transferase [Thermoleophilia bacterium]